MRILHIGSGFRPWRRGGLVAYAEDLMQAQVAQGHDVAYFFSGRQYPLARGPRLRRWKNRGIEMFEVVDSPLYDHGRQPELEISEPRTEELLRRAIAQIKPDVCHVQELAGLPSSVLEVLRGAGVPTLMTLQDYFLLCSTFKLLDAGGGICLRHAVGEDCLLSTRSDPRPAGLLIDATVRGALEQLPLVRPLRGRTRIARAIARVARLGGDLEARRRGRHQRAPAAEDFQRRREVNLARLNLVDVLIAMSTRVAEVYAQLGVSSERLRTVHLTLRHIEQLTPRQLTTPAAEPVTFATLAGFESSAKGANLIIGALRQLSSLAEAGRFRLLVFGSVDPAIAARSGGLAGLEIRGPYRPQDLNDLLESVDVGLVPSVWEEAYGYAGQEFLAKGIPVVANAIGGMTDYVREKETGWLNHTRSSDELARIMAGLIKAPAQVASLAARIVENRDTIIKSHAQHVAEMDRAYCDAISLAAGSALRANTMVN